MSESNPLVIRILGLTKLIGLSKATIYKLIKDGQFPRPIRLTGKHGAVAWRTTDVENWIASRPEA